MAQIVITNNVELFQMFGSRPFVRSDIDVAVATSGPEAMELIRRLPTDLALLEATLPELNGYEACRQVKDDPSCARTKVILILPPLCNPQVFAKIGESGCDGVLSLPVDEDELYEHVAQHTGLPARRSRRVRVSLQLDLQSGERVVPVEVQNISNGGMGFVARTKLEPGTSVILRLKESHGHGPADFPATIAWTAPEKGPLSSFGAEFHALGPELRSLVTELALWDVREAKGGVREVSINGQIDETCTFDKLLGKLTGSTRVDFDMGAVHRINSAGVRNWCNFIGALDSHQLSFRRCSVAFTSQISMVPTVIGSAGRVVSVKAPYACRQCDEEVERLVEITQLQVSPQIQEPHFACRCGGQLELDDLPERYFAFLRC